MTVSITELRLQNYGCVKELSLEGLGRLHAYIGPNDSGKSTILRALRTACYAFFHEWATSNTPFDPQLTAPFELHLVATGAELHITQRESHPAIAIAKWKEMPSFRTDNWTPQTMAQQGNVVPRSKQANFAFPPLMVRFDADSLRAPSELIPDGRSIQYKNERGEGLAGVFDAIRNRGDEAFAEIARATRQLFPTVRYVGLRNASSTTKELQLELVDGTKVPAAALSEGLLLYLAFAALPYVGQPPIVLVEEPENGLHPSRIKDVVRVLREVSKTSQVFLATHSPLVVNELEPEEVFVTTRSANEGTKVTRLDRTPNFEKRSSVYQNGELWIAYADGEQESALLGVGE